MRQTGCYRLLFGDWSVSETIQPTSLAYVLPPGRIELAAGPHRYRGRAARVHPLLPAPGYDAPPEFAFSAWEPVGSDSVYLVWGRGMAGVDMRLALRGDTLQGHARTFTDDQQPGHDPRASAAALRVPCALARPGEVDMVVDVVLHRLLGRERT